MRTLTIDKYCFDVILYPAIGTATHGETVAEVVMCAAVLTKLQVGTIEGPTQAASTFQEGQLFAPPPMRLLEGNEATYEFEDGQADYVVQKLLAVLPNLQGRQAVLMVPILRALSPPNEFDDVGIDKEKRV